VDDLRISRSWLLGRQIRFRFGITNRKIRPAVLRSSFSENCLIVDWRYDVGFYRLIGQLLCGFWTLPKNAKSPFYYIW